MLRQAADCGQQIAILNLALLDIIRNDALHEHILFAIVIGEIGDLEGSYPLDTPPIFDGEPIQVLVRAYGLSVGLENVIYPLNSVPFGIFHNLIVVLVLKLHYLHCVIYVRELCVFVHQLGLLFLQVDFFDRRPDARTHL